MTKADHLKWIWRTAAIAAILVIGVGFSPLYAATLTVTNNLDAGPGSLRAQIVAAASGDTINFAADYTITLTNWFPGLNKTLTIDGTGHSITIDGGDTFAAFWVSAGDLTLTTLTIANCTRAGFGAGIYIEPGGKLTATGLTCINNRAWRGGAIINHGTLAVTSSTFSGNATTLMGGAIYSTGTATLTSNTFSGNSAVYGGAVMNDNSGTLTLTSNAFSGNSATWGGAMMNNVAGTTTLISNTFSGNSATSGGGIHVGSGTVNLKNSIVTGNTGGDISGTLIDQGNNLVGIDALLGPLADYGGPTQTLALLPGSPAVDAISDGSCSSTDQRGLPRVGNCDIGSFESRGFTAGTLTGTPQATLVGTNFAEPLGMTVTANSPAEPVSGGKVTFTGPASGAGISPASVTGSIDVTGKVSANVTANGVQGAYTVVASGNGIGGSYAYSLANVVSPVANAVSAAVAYGSVGNVITLNITGGTPTSVAVVSAAAHGTATASGTAITYTPTTGYFGSDSFTYTATNAGGTSAPATVTITVNPQAPVANAVSATVAYNSSNNVITLNITGGAPTSVAVFGAASHGTATASGTAITYTPATGYFGSDSFTFTASNAGGTAAPATVTITVTLLAPVANPVSTTVAYGSSNNPITLNITGGPPASVAVSGAASHGTATASGTSITYTPTAGYSGGDSFTYTATNAAGTSPPATVTITISRTGNENSDRDGSPDLEEQGPYGNDPYHDGNGDGIPDWQQGNVVSFHTSAGDRSHYITLAAPSGLHIESLYGERNFDTPPPEWVSFPYGFFSFTIARLPAGSATTVTIYLDGQPPQTYYKYGKTPDNPVDHWYEFAYDGETGAEVVGNTVVLHFIDGKRGDHDLEANGGITDPGGPAEIAPHAGLYFPYLVSTSDEKTEIGVINTKSYASRSAISYYGANGDLLRTAAITLGPYGKAAISSAGLPPGSASAIVSGDGDLVGYTRYVNGAGKRCAWAAATSLQKTFSVPHTAVNAEWATALGLLNPNDAAVEVTLVYESGGSTKLTLNPKAGTFIRLTEVEPVISIVSTGYISAMEMLDSLLPGGDAAAVLLRERSLNALYVPSIFSRPGAFTGIGLNSYYHGLLHVLGHSATGAVEELSFGTQPLGAEGPRSRIAFVLSGMLREEDLWAKISGEADFTTAAGKPLLHFQGLAVYGEDDTRKLGALNLNALRFREGFIGILSAAEETTLTVLNPDTAEATITVTGYSAAGEALAGNTIKVGAGSRWTGTATDLLNGVSGAGMTHIRMVSDADLYGFEMISANDRIEMLPVMGME